MSHQLIIYTVHQDVATFLAPLAIGWLIVLFGTWRFGLRFAFAALLLGLLISASQFMFRGDLWRQLLDPTTAATIAAYWLIPAGAACSIGLLIRSARTRRTDEHS